MKKIKRLVKVTTIKKSVKKPEVNNKQHTDLMAMVAMMNGGMGNQWNNPFIYLVWKRHLHI